MSNSHQIYSNYNNYDALCTLSGDYSRDNVYQKGIELLNHFKNIGKFNFLT